MEKDILNDLINRTNSNLFTNKENIYYIFKMKNKNLYQMIWKEKMNKFILLIWKYK